MNLNIRAKTKIINSIIIFIFIAFAISSSLIIYVNRSFGVKFTEKELDKTVISASRKYGIPVPFLIAVMRAESGFDMYAVSPKGAVGLMQIMPETGETLHENIDNPLTNITAGAKYLHYCLERFSFDPVPALACYNAGPDSVKTAYYKTGKKYIIPPYRHTQIYILRVYRYYNFYRKLLKR